MHDAEWLAVVLGGVLVFAVGVCAGWWLLKWELHKQGYRLRWQRDEKGAVNWTQAWLCFVLGVLVALVIRFAVL